MASEAFIHDLSEYLFAGNFSDLTISYGEKSWQAHRAIACSHSLRFRTVLTGDSEEKISGEISLKDEPEFADAIDCMLSYFYRADYDTSRYDASTPLLHARVAVIADRYDCASLYELAKTSLASSIGTAGVKDWVEIAALVYSCTSSDRQADVDLRNLVVFAVPDHPDMLASFFQNESFEQLLRSTADLGADLLLSRAQKVESKRMRWHILTCDHCHYAHAGSPDCATVVHDEFDVVQTCPQCKTSDSTITKKYVQKIRWPRAKPCPSCDGMHVPSSQEAESEYPSTIST